jgi:hypothetical protein
MKPNDIVSASEIASWAWCPESWRLQALGNEPENQADLRRGELHHAQKAFFEKLSRLAILLGWWFIAVAVLVAIAVLALARR